MRFVRNFLPRHESRRASRSGSGIDCAEILARVAAETASGDFGAALALVDDALEARPDDFDLRFARASTLFSWWRYAEAHAVLAALESSGTRDAAFYVKLGWTCYWLNLVDEAGRWMRQAVAKNGDDWATHFGRGIALRALKRPAASRQAFERVLALKPDDPHAISNLVACDVELGHLDRAERHARHGVELDAASSSAVVDLAIVLCEQQNYSDAVAAFERADELGFASADARDESVNYAICLLRAGKAHQAIVMMEKKLRQHPSSALHAHYALALLISGRMREGWDQYEFRWLQEPLLSWRPKFFKPVWAGQDLRGKTILLRAEQGYGDFIQFIRYAPYVKALGATVLLEVREELRELAQTAAGIDRILRSDEPHPSLDYYIHLLSLPRVLGTELDSIPADVPYLAADPGRTARWAEHVRDDNALNVGIVWAGSPTHLGDRFRSLSLRDLAPLRAIEGVRFHSLQKGPAVAELVTDRGGEAIVELGSKLVTFADTAALIDRLDLVISVDTSVVHLAGALAKPVWTLVAIPGDWRWLEEREDSPWYPTMRLFRQRAPGAWDDVIARLKAALEEQVSRRRVRGASARRSVETFSPLPPGRPHEQPTDLCRVAETRAGIIMYVPRDTDTARSIELYGECAHLEFEALARIVEPGMVALEAGAGIGVHSVPLAARLGADGHLFLYEADAFLRQALHENIKANRIANTTLMRRSLAGSARHNDAASPAGPLASAAPGEAPTDLETIDELRLERLELIKISRSVDADVFVEGATETFERLRPRLFIAAADEAAVPRLVSRLRRARYRCWKAETPMFNAANFNGIDIDIFAGRKSLALLALPDDAALDTKLGGWEPIA
jgi:tetratricopeptide (TPR) repeat protein